MAWEPHTSGKKLPTRKGGTLTTRLEPPAGSSFMETSAVLLIGQTEPWLDADGKEQGRLEIVGAELADDGTIKVKWKRIA